MPTAGAFTVSQESDCCGNSVKRSSAGTNIYTTARNAQSPPARSNEYPEALGGPRGRNQSWITDAEDIRGRNAVKCLAITGAQKGIRILPVSRSKTPGTVPPLFQGWTCRPLSQSRPKMQRAEFATFPIKKIEQPAGILVPITIMRMAGCRNT
jgi:hypothetical protein